MGAERPEGTLPSSWFQLHSQAGGLLSGSAGSLFPCTLGLLPAGDPGPFRK